MLQLRDAITHELTQRSHKVSWLEDGADRGWHTNTSTYIQDPAGYISGYLTPKQIVESLWFDSRPGHRTRDFVMMLHQIPDDCVRPAKVHADNKPVFVLYYDCQ